MSGTSIVTVAGDGVHHRVRREWMARLRRLRSDAARLRARGEYDVWVTRYRSELTKAGMRNHVAASFGLGLLFEVEAFRAEDLDSVAEAWERRLAVGVVTPR